MVQAAVMTDEAEVDLPPSASAGSFYGLIALHNDPHATVYMVIGTAGQGFQERAMTPQPVWNELTMLSYGYAIVSAVNSTCLVWETIQNSDDSVLDKMVIIQPAVLPISFGMAYEPMTTLAPAVPPRAFGQNDTFSFAFLMFASAVIFTISLYAKRHQESKGSNQRVLFSFDESIVGVTCASEMIPLRIHSRSGTGKCYSSDSIQGSELI